MNIDLRIQLNTFLVSYKKHQNNFICLIFVVIESIELINEVSYRCLKRSLIIKCMLFEIEYYQM